MNSDDSILCSHQATLYSYWRSSCSWRVRIALELLSPDESGRGRYEIVPVNLLLNEQKREEYVRMNPAGVVPTLTLTNKQDSSDVLLLTQSIAILEFLSATHKDLLLPRIQAVDGFAVDQQGAACVRAIVQCIASDTQPVQNLHVLQYIESIGGDKAAWAKRAICKGLSAATQLIESSSRGRDSHQRQFCVGDRVTMADVVLVPQVYNAERFGIDVRADFPLIHAICTHLASLDAFRRAHPDVQPDKPVSS